MDVVERSHTAGTVIGYLYTARALKEGGSGDRKACRHFRQHGFINCSQSLLNTFRVTCFQLYRHTLHSNESNWSSVYLSVWNLNPRWSWYQCWRYVGTQKFCRFLFKCSIIPLRDDSSKRCLLSFQMDRIILCICWKKKRRNIWHFYKRNKRKNPRGTSESVDFLSITRWWTLTLPNVEASWRLIKPRESIVDIRVTVRQFFHGKQENREGTVVRCSVSNLPCMVRVCPVSFYFRKRRVGLPCKEGGREHFVHRKARLRESIPNVWFWAAKSRLREPR